MFLHCMRTVAVQWKLTRCAPKQIRRVHPHHFWLQQRYLAPLYIRSLLCASLPGMVVAPEMASANLLTLSPQGSNYVSLFARKCDNPFLFMPPCQGSCLEFCSACVDVISLPLSCPGDAEWNPGSNNKRDETEQTSSSSPADFRSILQNLQEGQATIIKDTKTFRDSQSATEQPVQMLTQNVYDLKKNEVVSSAVKRAKARHLSCFKCFHKSFLFYWQARRHKKPSPA